MQSPIAVAGYPFGGDSLSITKGIVSRVAMVSRGWTGSVCLAVDAQQAVHATSCSSNNKGSTLQALGFGGSLAADLVSKAGWRTQEAQPWHGPLHAWQHRQLRPAPCLRWLLSCHFKTRRPCLLFVHR